jgi:hypothetical protein
MYSRNMLLICQCYNATKYPRRVARSSRQKFVVVTPALEAQSQAECATQWNDASIMSECCQAPLLLNYQGGGLWGSVVALAARRQQLVRVCGRCTKILAGFHAVAFVVDATKRITRSRKTTVELNAVTKRFDFVVTKRSKTSGIYNGSRSGYIAGIANFDTGSAMYPGSRLAPGLGSRMCKVESTTMRFALSVGPVTPQVCPRGP